LGLNPTISNNPLAVRNFVILGFAKFGPGVKFNLIIFVLF